MNSNKCLRQTQPHTEDVRKLHAEINQLLNQVTLLNIASIAIFGAIASATFYKSDFLSSKFYLTPIPTGIVFVSASLLLILLVLFLIGHTYFRIIRYISAYMVATNSSIWEQHYWMHAANRRREFYFLYSETRVILFLTLGLFSVALPFGIWMLTPQEFESSIIGGATFALFIIYVTVVLCLGMSKNNHIDHKMIKRWRVFFDRYDFGNSREQLIKDADA